MARLDVNITTSLVGAGLEKEAYILKDLFAAHDVYTVLIHYTSLANATLVRADINIFFEVIAPIVLNLSRENWFVPNSEWYDPRNDAYLNRFTKILCKTKHCYEVWCNKVGKDKCIYTSFEARDIYKPEIPREFKFLHLAGKSEHKNTEAVIKAYRATHLPHVMPLPPLTIVARAPVFEEMLKDEFYDKNVTWIPKATDEEVIQLMNSHQFHLMPSMYEGFGHVLHEGLGCSAVMLTTDAPPMNTYEGIWREGLIPVSYQEQRSLVKMNVISNVSVEAAIRRVNDIRWTRPEVFDMQSQCARAAFLSNREFFRKTIMELVDNVHR